ncbi:MAG: thermonuclease family protein [Gammaproteobacteria bacterium]
MSYPKWAIVVLICFPPWADADIYQWRDAVGNRHYSDRSHPFAEKLEIKPGYGYHRVKTIYDGDTLVLDDGRKIRLLGINTPEVRHRDRRAEAGGEEARRWLTNALQGAKIRLETDVERRDHYGRILAHIFTEDGKHINRMLVEAGLAAVNIHPPNLLYSEQLGKAQRLAENTQAGIWGQKDYAVMPVDRLPDSGHPGWVRLRGRVSDIRSSRKYLYLIFSDRFEATIERKWQSLFPDADGYLGKTIEVRGWLTKYKGKFLMRIRHPSAIRLS